MDKNSKTLCTSCKYVCSKDLELVNTSCSHCRNEAGLWRYCYNLQCSLAESRASESGSAGVESTSTDCSINATLIPSAAEVRAMLTLLQWNSE